MRRIATAQSETINSRKDNMLREYLKAFGAVFASALALSVVFAAWVIGTVYLISKLLGG